MTTVDKDYSIQKMSNGRYVVAWWDENHCQWQSPVYGDKTILYAHAATLDGLEGFVKTFPNKGTCKGYIDRYCTQDDPTLFAN